MILTAVILSLLIAEGNARCGNDGVIGLPALYANFTTARQLSLAEETRVIQLYGLLTIIKDYTVSISGAFHIYINHEAICDKTPTQPQTFIADKDLWTCLDDFYLMKCNEEWKLLIKCGTFLEFHKPFNPEALLSFNLEEAAWVESLTGGSITNLSTKSLCAGLYHIWFVYYSRGGKFLQGVKTVYIGYPSCVC